MTMTSSRNASPPPGRAPSKNMVWIPGGTFLMGSDLAQYPEEGPPHQVTVDGFWIDQYAVTVDEFRQFVRATGYKTVAEQSPDPAYYPNADPAALVPGSMVFQKASGPVPLDSITNWWTWVPGACWKHPEGPRSNVAKRERHPVVHVAWEDVQAYAAWAGKEIPTEAEWEYAARGGLDGAMFTWGEEERPRKRIMANHWQGEFPYKNLKHDGYEGTAPVGSFPANGYGLYDMAGNVWEWTSDFYTSRHPEAATHACCVPTNPRIESPDGSYDLADPGGAHIPRRVIKGGSHLCAPNYCLRYRPAARQPQMVDTGMAHIGFRCVVRPGSS
ncbi:MAG TPA: formylglycine-generating enzyme family protein [Chloroflexota bacterium]|nr:formylglycine-generating enzyme family protein [Chloroflexota bacterium]